MLARLVASAVALGAAAAKARREAKAERKALVEAAEKERADAQGESVAPPR